MVKTIGIVIRQLKFKETSIITKIFSKELGLRSYIINGIRITKQRKPSIPPLTVLEIDVHNKKKLTYLKEFKINSSFNADIKKGLTSLYISEILDKTIREDVIYENLFDFILSTVNKLHALNEDYVFFILNFMINFSKYLGVGINELKEMNKQIMVISNSYKLNDIEEALLNDLLNNKFVNVYNKNNAFSLLNKIIIFLQNYYISLKSISSFEIVKSFL